MPKIKCRNCQYIWTYKGASTYYCCCPRCRRALNIKNNTTQEQTTHPQPKPKETQEQTIERILARENNQQNERERLKEIEENTKQL